MQSEFCLNCGKGLSPSQKYCSRCGQKADIKRFSVIVLVRDFFQSLVDVDKGLLLLLRGLGKAPGQVATNYIEGKRKRYMNPFAFLALSVAFSLLISNWISPYESLPRADYGDMEKMPTEELKQQSKIASERALNVQKFVNENMNIITVFITPYVAFMLWLFFRRKDRNFSEITIAYLLFTAFAILISSFITYLPMIFFRSYMAFTIITWTSLILQTLYYAWGLKGFFGFQTTGGYFKILAVLVLTGIIGFIIILFALFFYVYNGSWDLIYYLSQPKRDL